LDTSPRKALKMMCPTFLFDFDELQSAIA